MLPYRIPRLPEAPDAPFPDPLDAAHPEGLIAWGGDLEPIRLVNAYRNGIFPWFENDGPILWWCPDPRAVLPPGGMHISRRLHRRLRKGGFTASLDACFDRVIEACAAPREGQPGTWITPRMATAYRRLHHLGLAHSVEIELDGELSGGLYGVSLGKIFFAESKFHVHTDSSKIALAVLMRCLDRWGFMLCDCQVWNPHLERLGARLMKRAEFLRIVRRGTSLPDRVESWGSRLEQEDYTGW